MKISKPDKDMVAWCGIATWTALVAEFVTKGPTNWGMFFAGITALFIGIYYFSEVEE